MPKIYLTYSKKEYASAAGERACVLLRRYTERLAACLAEGGIETKTGEHTLRRCAEECKSFRPDIFYTASAAAFDGRRRGSSLYILPKADRLTAVCAREIKICREGIYPAPAAVKRSGNIYELRAAGGIGIYDELAYFDNARDAAFICGNAEKLAENTASALCRILRERDRGCIFSRDDSADAPRTPYGGRPLPDDSRLLPEAEEEMISHIGPFPEDGGVYISILPDTPR